MKRLQKVITIVMLSIICTANVAFAVPVKVDEDNRTTATQTVKPAGTATSKPKSSATAKATATAQTTAKATSTAKVSATPKATAKQTSEPKDDDDKIVLDSDDEAIILETTAEPTLNIQNGAQQLENKKYLTKAGAFLWFLFTVIVSAVISFAIAYRFYVMGRRDNHLVAEIRALKRDIDNKMVGTIGGFSEYDVTVTNGNRGYAKENTSIRSGVTAESEDENNEIYKKWENKINSVQKASENNRAAYTGTAYTRGSSREIERRRPVKTKNTMSVKIKNVLNDIFPFDKK